MGLFPLKFYFIHIKSVNEVKLDKININTY